MKVCLAILVGAYVFASSEKSSLVKVAKNLQPHIFYLLVDDYGWGDAGWHRINDPSKDIVTPNLDALVAEGVELDRFYTHKFCGPSRAALQTGRNPIHVTVLDNPIPSHNPKDPVGGFQGIPRNMTGIATKLASAGYATHMAGKWHCGVATPDHTPQGRGYQTSLHYFDASNDYWTNQYLQECEGVAVTDLWETDAPARGLNNSFACSQDNQAPNCTYEDQLLTDHVIATINASDPSKPFFFFWAPHSVHEPYEVPQAYLDKYSFITLELRQYYAAMVSYIDDQIGRVVAALKAKGMWDNMLFVMTSDNGGPLANGNVSFPADRNGAGANNYPLRGGKIGIMEGGVRVNAFASGGLIPVAVRGSKQEGLIGMEDWYATFCGLAGVDPSDERAKAAGLPPIDSIDQWPLISGNVTTGLRDEIWLGSSDDSDHQGNTIIQGLIRADGYKLIIGKTDPAFLQGPTYPNNSDSANSRQPNIKCGDPDGSGSEKGTGCLFNVLADPSETEDFAAEGKHGDIITTIRKRMHELQQGVYSPNRGKSDSLMCDTALNKWGGFVGPFLP